MIHDDVVRRHQDRGWFGTICVAVQCVINPGQLYAGALVSVAWHQDMELKQCYELDCLPDMSVEPYPGDQSWKKTCWMSLVNETARSSSWPDQGGEQPSPGMIAKANLNKIQNAVKWFRAQLAYTKKVDLWRCYLAHATFDLVCLP